MSDTPPPFYSDPARLVALAPDDADYTGPDRLAREAAEATVERDDAALAACLGRAWRSGAPEELLGQVLGSYACAHDLAPDDARAIESLAHLVPAGAAGPADLGLVRVVADAI